MPLIEVSAGELLDKWSILEIKLGKLLKPSQQLNIAREMQVLKDICQTYLDDAEILKLYKNLYKVNLDIWIGMDHLYEIDSSQSQIFIDLTNKITSLNKDRAYIKKEIDSLVNSGFSEEKSYF